MQAAFYIDGRKAYPVRALPFVTGFDSVSPDVLIYALEGHEDHHYDRERHLPAYRLNEGTVELVRPANFNFHRVQITSHSLKLRGEEIKAGENHGQWRESALEMLPAGVFVWESDLVDWLRRSLPLVWRDSAATPAQRVVPVADSPDVPSSRLQRIVAEGFDDQLPPARFAERQFVDGFNAVQNQRRNDPSRAARIHDVSLTVDRCRELASKEKLTIADWTELTGVGRGVFGMYEISADCIQFRRWTDEEIRGFSSSEQPDMDRENDSPSLSFACSPSALVTFVDCADIGGRHFDVPEAFRLALSALQLGTGVWESLSSLAPKKIDRQEQEKIEVNVSKTFQVGIGSSLADKEPYLDKGLNKRERIKPWIEWCVRNIKEDGDTAQKLAVRIVQRADKGEIESQNGPLTITSVMRLFPRGSTGRRGRRPGSQAKIK